MKEFIEVELKNKNILLINVDAIESVIAYDNSITTIYMKTALSRHDGYHNEQELYQFFYEVRQSYEEVKAMIEEAMK